jgi:RNA polymerase sigma-70 factor (ECF subfamily)
MTLANFDLGVSYAALDESDAASESLLSRLRRAEPAAVGEAYDQNHDAVRAFARRLVGDPEAAEDLVHEVFVSLPRAIRRYREQSSLRTFLISIAVNHARHFVRAAARRRSALDRLAREPINHPVDPEHEARDRELGRALIRALDDLPLDQRVAFVLCEVEERTSRDAAAIVGVPEATVRTRLFHAKKRLRARLEKEGLR